MDIILFGLKLGLGFALGWHLVAVPVLAAVLLWLLVRRAFRRHKDESVKINQLTFGKVVASSDGTILSGLEDGGLYWYSQDAGYTWSGPFLLDALPDDVIALWEVGNGH